MIFICMVINDKFINNGYHFASTAEGDLHLCAAGRCRKICVQLQNLLTAQGMAMSTSFLKIVHLHTAFTNSIK